LIPEIEPPRPRANPLARTHPTRLHGSAIAIGPTLCLGADRSGKFRDGNFDLGEALSRSYGCFCARDIALHAPLPFVLSGSRAPAD